MSKTYLNSALVLIVAFTATIAQCFAGEVQGGRNHAFSVPDMAATRVTPEQAFMHALSQSNLSDDAKHITVKELNGSTVLTGYVKNDKERQRIGNMARQANCLYVLNKLKIKSDVAEVQNSDRRIKSKTVFIKDGKQIIVH